jgi:peptidoglycan/xylan/chitin deacetylase (PgdA/CDA1 family)
MRSASYRRRVKARVKSQVTGAVISSAAFGRLVGALERLDHPSDHVLTVLTYHRIDEPGCDPLRDPALVSATPADFELQIAYLAAHRPMVSLDDVLAVRRNERALPPGAVMVTFDDASRDFAENAWPVLKRHGAPATLFVPTAMPDRPERAFWWDRLHAAVTATERREPIATPAGVLPLGTAEDRHWAKRALAAWIKSTPHADAMAALDRLVLELDGPAPGNRVLGWDELRALREEGVGMAAHSRTHPLLHRVPLADAQDEVLGSLHDVERELGAAPPAFAFPGGGHSHELVEWLRDAGIELAFTTIRGLNDLRRLDWLRLRRINVGQRSTVPVIRGQMLSWLSNASRVQIGSRTA